MRLGLMLGYWMPDPWDPTDLVQETERLGYDSVWTAEAYGSDVFSPLCWVGARTKRIKLGTAIMQISARTPACAAMTAATIDHLSGGRRVLGVGVSGPQVVEGWDRLPGDRLAERRPRAGAPPDQVHARVLHRRHGGGGEELPPEPDRAARVRGGGAPGAGALPGGEAGGGGGGGAGSARRRDLARGERGADPRPPRRVEGEPGDDAPRRDTGPGGGAAAGGGGPVA